MILVLSFESAERQKTQAHQFWVFSKHFCFTFNHSQTFPPSSFNPPSEGKFPDVYILSEHLSGSRETM